MASWPELLDIFAPRRQAMAVGNVNLVELQPRVQRVTGRRPPRPVLTTGVTRENATLRHTFAAELVSFQVLHLAYP
jgi:hypothetical protein